MLDHISGGRRFGVAASASHWAMFWASTGMSGVNRDMTREALEIILRLWSDEPHRGKFWNVTKPEPMFGFLRPHGPSSTFC